MHTGDNAKLAILLMLALAAPLHAATPAANAGRQEGQAPMDAVATITLRDVHPLHGGQVVYLSADGSGYCQLVTHPSGTPALHEQRYRLALPADTLAALWQRLPAATLAAIPSSTRAALPGAARTRIAARLASGKVIDISRWAGDQQADFDAIYSRLLDIALQAPSSGTLLTEGKFDPAWTPPGY